MRLFTLLGKDARVLLRSPLLMVVLLLYPLIIVGILGYAFSEPNERIPIAVVNEDVDAQGEPNVAPITSPIPGREARGNISTQDILEGRGRTFQGLSEYAELHYVTEDEGRRMLLRGEVQGIVHFPFHFARDVGEFSANASIEIVIDQSDPVRANLMETLIRGIVQEFQEYVVGEKVDSLLEVINKSLSLNLGRDDPFYPGFPTLIANLERLRNSPELENNTQALAILDDALEFLRFIRDTLTNSESIVESIAEPVRVDITQEKSGNLFVRDLIVPAALGLGVFWTGSLATSALVVYERESDAYTRLRITPTTAASIYGSKILLTLLIVFLQALVILLAAVLAWNTRVDNALLTVVVIILSSFAAIGLGLFLAGISRDVTTGVLLSVLFTFPMLFVAGIFFPVSFMPDGAQLLANAFPLTHSVAALRGGMLRGFGFGEAFPMLTALFLFGVGLSLLGIILGQRLERKK